MQYATLLFILTNDIVLFGVLGLRAEILQPLAYNAYLGQPDQEVFTCLLWEQEFIRWNINGERISSSITASTGIVMSNSETRNPTRSGLIIPATATNANGIYVQCVAIPIPTTAFVVSNETGHFRVQGLLNMIQSSVTSTSYNKSHNLVSWEKPFTLDITNVEPDIYGYTVCYYLHPPMLDFKECEDIANTSIIIEKYSVSIQVRIFASNIVGEGNTVVHTVDPCLNSYSGLLGAATVDFWNNNTQVHLNLQAIEEESVEICLHQLNVTIHLLNSPNTTLTVFEAVLFASNELAIEYEFQRNAEYVAVVRYVGSGNQSSFSFSTFDIQSTTVTVENQNNMLTISCLFAPGTTALGFYVELLLSEELVSRSVSLPQSCGLISEQMCTIITVFDIPYGNYFLKLSVYDWERDGSINKVYHEEFQEIFSSGPNSATSVKNTAYDKESGNNSEPVTIQLSTATVGEIIGGSTGALLVCFIILLFIILLLFICKRICSTKRENVFHQDKSVLRLRSDEASTLTQNEAYDLVLRMQNNKAYTTVTPASQQHTIDIEQPHVYEEILPQAISTHVPIYTHM